jgi:hypothetical protein
MNKKVVRREEVGCLVWSFWLLVVLGFWSGVGYVAFHFIHKFW